MFVSIYFAEPLHLPGLVEWPHVVGPLCGLYSPSCCSWALIAVGTSMGGIDPQAYQLQGLAATTVEDLLCWCPAHRVGRTSAGPWCLLSVPLECVTCGGGWVVLRCGPKLSTGCTGSGASQEVQAKVSRCLCSVQGYPAWTTKWSADGCYLCWMWRCRGEATLWTKASCD